MGLAVVNSLDREYELIGGAIERSRPTAFERYLKSRRLRTIFRYPSPTRDEPGFRRALFEACRRYEVDGVFPASTASATALARMRRDGDIRALATVFVIEEYEKVAQLADKWKLYQLCRELDIPAPRTVLPVGEGVEGLTQLSLPVVAKPRVAEAARGVRIIQTREELQRLVESPPKMGCSDLDGEYPYIVQELIPGELHGACACTQGGQPVSLMTNHRVFTRHEFGGNGLVHRTTYEPELMEYATKMLGHVEWNGPINLEFVRDAQGRYFLLDANTRVWGSTELAVAAGLNVCQQAVDIFVLGKKLEPTTQYEIGMVCKWLTLGTLARCFREPRTPRAIAARLAKVFAPHRKTVTNLHPRNFLHLIGMALDNLAKLRNRSRPTNETIPPALNGDGTPAAVAAGTGSAADYGRLGVDFSDAELRARGRRAT